MSVHTIKKLLFLPAFVLVLACGDDGGEPGDNFLPRESLADEDQSLSRYNVNGDAISLAGDHEVDAGIEGFRSAKADHQRMWGRFRGLVPASRRTFVKQFTAFHGGDAISGYVYPLQSDRVDWSLGLDILTAQAEFASLDNASVPAANKNVPLAFTAAHEYAHLLTLHGDELDLSISEASCTTFYNIYGCASASSYIGDFYNAFWSGAVFADYESKLATFGRDGVAEQMFMTYPADFVSEYAASSVEEDIAESFARYVFSSNCTVGIPSPPGCTVPPPPADISEQKIRFFNSYPEIAALRLTMRNYLFDVVDGTVPLTGISDVAYNVDFQGRKRSCGLAIH